MRNASRSPSCRPPSSSSDCAGRSPASAVEYEFPPGNTGFHTYLEMAAEVKAAADAYPTIVKRFSIGKSCHRAASSGR